MRKEITSGKNPSCFSRIESDFDTYVLWKAAIGSLRGPLETWLSGS
jgi:hypothetical protein